MRRHGEKLVIRSLLPDAHVVVYFVVMDYTTHRGLANIMESPIVSILPSHVHPGSHIIDYDIRGYATGRVRHIHLSENRKQRVELLKLILSKKHFFPIQNA